MVVVRGDIFQRYPANSTLKGDSILLPLLGCTRSKPSYSSTFKV